MSFPSGFCQEDVYKRQELDCLRERAPKQYANLHRIEAELREILARLLTPEILGQELARSTLKQGLSYHNKTG